MTSKLYPKTNWQDIIEANSTNQEPVPFQQHHLFKPADRFVKRHVGPRSADVNNMLEAIGLSSLDELIDQAVPHSIRGNEALSLESPRSESDVLKELRDLAGKNKVFHSYIGMGYSRCTVPPVIQRNVLESPGWYTQYTPYQAEIAQGRLEALINFQTMVADLTGMEIANASMLDEGTSAAEAMTLCLRAQPRKSTANTFFISELCHPQTIAVIQQRAEPLGINLVIGDHHTYEVSADTFGVLLQYPATTGEVFDYEAFCTAAHEVGALVAVAADLMSLVLLRSPGDFGADVVVGNSQRFGVPMGYGGPHAAFMATSEKYQRIMPGRIVGVSKDATGRTAYRLALQTREQHIRRERATSNICTAQVLLAIMASMYAVYHGPVGLTRIAKRIRLIASVLGKVLTESGYELSDAPIFDTLLIKSGPQAQYTTHGNALQSEVNLRYFENGSISISLDEVTSETDLLTLIKIFGIDPAKFDLAEIANTLQLDFDKPYKRTTEFMTHPVFNSHQSETEMMRYIHKLQKRDLSLTHSMIPLGSCTMKLNATAEMLPISQPGFAFPHPFAPLNQTEGYQILFERLEEWLAKITGFAAISLQPNSGAQGEYTGLLVIRAYHLANGDDHRDICLIPSSAHGTNPASASMVGMKVVVVECDEDGNIDVADMRLKAEKHSDNLAAAMITYPSTHGVYEEDIKLLCEVVHEHGGQVYMDGANMNAQVGLTSPGIIGADVCHLNLHKTFCIPHGGGGPGMGPIGVVEHLAPFLPGHPVVPGIGGSQAIGPVSSAPWGSAGILPIPYAYIAMMGDWGLTVATEIAILNANYMAKRLEKHYPVLYRGKNGRVAHECIIELRHLKEFASVDDVAKRLMDYGFHAPTMSFPVAGTLMIEPTESESLAEIDRFCDAMIQIREEIRQIEEGEIDPLNNPLVHAPHSAEIIMSDDWDRPYSRQVAAFPLEWVKENKFWPFVSRIDNVYGDRNLNCNCVPIADYR